MSPEKTAIVKRRLSVLPGNIYESFVGFSILFSFILIPAAPILGLAGAGIYALATASALTASAALTGMGITAVVIPAALLAFCTFGATRETIDRIRGDIEKLPQTTVTPPTTTTTATPAPLKSAFDNTKPKEDVQNDAQPKPPEPKL